MTDHPRFDQLTIQLPVPDVGAAAGFYRRLFGRDPDFAPHEDFLEWQAVPGTWVQVCPGTATGGTGRLRFGVADIRAAVAWAEASLRVACAPIHSLPGVVAFTDFTDPYGHGWGFFQDLVDPATAVGPAGSVTDETLFVAGVADPPKD
jgi:hypothetical protein